MAITIKERASGNVTILDLSGKILLGDGDGILRMTVQEALQEGKKKILLNMKDVSYLDSSGLGTLISSYTTTNNQGGKLKLLNVTQRIQDLLMITKLITIFELYDNEKTAVESFG